MPNNNDLSILIKILLENTSKTNLKTEVENLVNNLNKLKVEIKLDDKIISTINNLSKVMENMNTITQGSNKSSTQNIQIIKELDGTVKKYSETVKANGEIIQKTTEIIDKNKTAKQQATKATDNINKEAEAVDKLITKYDKLIRTVKIKDNKGEVLRQDQTYLNSQTGVKTTVASRPGQDNIYRTDASKNNELLKEQMKLARESAKLAKESNDYHQKYYKVQQKAFEEGNKEYLRGAKLREKSEQDRLKKEQKSFDEGNKEFARGIKLKSKLFDENNKEYLRGIKLRQVEEVKQYKVKDTVNAFKNNYNTKIGNLQSGNISQYVNPSDIKIINDKIEAIKRLDSVTKNEIKTLYEKAKANAQANKITYEQGIGNQKNNLIQNGIKQLQDEKKQRQKNEEDYIKQLRKYAEEKLKLNRKTFDEENVEYLRGVKLREKADADAERNRQKYIQDRIKQMQQEQKQQELISNNNIKLMRQEAEARLKYYSNSQKIKGTDFNAENAEFLRGVKLREKAEQDLQKLKQKQIQDSIKQLQQEQKERDKSQQDYIKQLRLIAEEKLRSHQISLKLIDQENTEYLRGIKLREQEQQKFIANQERINKQLNTKSQNALNLGVKFGNLSPEQLAPLEKALARYKTLISSMQQKNISGQIVSDKDIERLQRLENAIKRVYDNTRIASKDSRGFNFEQYPKMTNAVQGATNAQNYYNQSIMHGKKLLEANVQETEKYIKVTQRLREGSKITSVTAYVNKLNGETYKFSESMRDLMRRTWDLGSAFKTAFEKIGLWAGATGIFYGVANSLQQMGREIINVDTKLTELSKVLDNSTNWSKLMRDTAESANMMARSLTEALDAEIEFAKQGFEAAQAVELAKTSMLGANVTGLKTGEMANYLTGILAQFNIEAEKSSTIIDKLNEVDNNFAVTSIGLAQSINKAGEAAQQYGLTIDDLIGYTTAIQTSTRESGNQIGNMLKTVISRINMDKTQEKLTSLGIAVKDISGDLLPLNTIYNSVATKWDSMTRAEKTTTAEAIAGRHHITRLMALFDNWNIVTDATATSQTSLGSAIEENYKHLHSLESQINRNKAAFQELAYTMGESGVKQAMSSVLSTTSQYINGLSEMTKFNGLLINSSVLLGTVILLKLVPAIKTEYRDWIVRNGLVSTAIPLNKKLTISYAALTTMIKGATTSLIAFSKAMLKNPLTWIITAITIIPMMLGHMKQVREEQEQLNRTYEETKQKLDEILERSNKIGSPKLQDVNDIDATINKLEELKNKLEEIDQIHRSGKFGFQLSMVKDLPKELKDLAVQMGININQYTTLDQVFKAIDETQKTLSGTLGNAKVNSTEYQKTLIDQANNQTKVADNNIELINTYEELSKKSNLTVEEQKKLNDITAILTQTYPDLIQIKDDVIIISDEVISKIKDEANAQKNIADENEKSTRKQIINNRARLQDQITTSLGIIQNIEKEIVALENANIVKADPNNIVKKQNEHFMNKIEGKDTPYSSSLNVLMAEMNTPSTKLSNLKKKYEVELANLKQKYNDMAAIDDTLNSSISDLNKSDSDKETNPVTNLISKYTVEQEKIDALIEKSKAIQETLIPSSAEYRKETEEQIKLLKDKQNSIHDENLALTNLSKTTQLTDEQKNQSAKQYAKNSTEWYKIQKDIYEGSDKMMANTLSEFTSQLTELDNKQQFIEKTASKYSKSSQAYRDSIQLEIDIIKEKNNVLHQANEFIREQIASGKLTEQQAEEYRKQLQPNSNTYASNVGEVDTKNLDILKSKYEELDIPIQQITDRLSMLQTVQSLYDEGSQQYVDNTQQQINVNKELISALQAKHKAIEADLALAEKGTTTYEELSNMLSDVIKAELDAVQKKKEFIKDITDDTIDLMKEVYEKEKDIALDAIEEQMEKEEEAYNKRIKMLEDEMDEYEKSVNDKIKLIDKLADKENYETDLAKAQKERQDIQNKINILGMDTSAEAKSKVNDLTKELLEKDDEIKEMQKDRENELRKDSLNSLLDDYKEENDAKKELENDKYDSTKKNLDKQKKATERYYQDMIANEIKFNNMKEDLASGNVDNIISEIQRLIDFVNENEDSFGAGLGETLTSNLQDKIDQISNNIGSGSSGSGSGNSNDSSQTNDNSKYRPIINEITFLKGQYLEGQNANDTTKMAWASKAAVGYYNQLPTSIADKLHAMDYEEAYKYLKGGVYHEGGSAVSKGKSPNKIQDLIDNVFNKGIKSNELRALLENGESVLSENAVNNFIPTLQSIISKFIPNISIPNMPKIATANSGISGGININIATVNTQDNNSLNNFFTKIDNKLSKLGRK